MTAEELWSQYQQINPGVGDLAEAWAFGAEPDLLAQLVLEGTKTATASAYDLYEPDHEPLPKEDSYDVILDSRDQAICIIRLLRLVLFPSRTCQQSTPIRKERVIKAWKSGGSFMTPFSDLILKRQAYALQRIALLC